MGGVYQFLVETTPGKRCATFTTVRNPDRAAPTQTAALPYTLAFRNSRTGLSGENPEPPDRNASEKTGRCIVNIQL